MLKSHLHHFESNESREFTGSSWSLGPGEAPPSAEAVDVGPGDWTRGGSASNVHGIHGRQQEKQTERGQVLRSPN